ncbi:hypothetical protein KC19_VG097700 [Ceratodon purpureus]|uniref:Uncharacterized protein n=1 Tax=Ceratodon purpureus TaxID=3225 RepID=A0A8T0HNX6_CERPU|nr:hypothetical protein KC19_VG097700 [Ceratodon purpureus]
MQRRSTLQVLQRRRHRQRQRRWHWNQCLMGDQLSGHYAFTRLNGHESSDEEGRDDMDARILSWRKG